MLLRGFTGKKKRKIRKGLESQESALLFFKTEDTRICLYTDSSDPEEKEK